MIVCYDEELISHIYEVVIQNYLLLANNQNGLCIAKKVIIHARNIETLQEIRNKIASNLLNLIQNAYGNYAIQVAFEVINIFYF